MDKVMFMHYRLVGGDKVSSCGGVTVCVRELPFGAKLGGAVCVMTDNYNKRLGRIKSLGRSRSSNKRFTQYVPAERYNDREELRCIANGFVLQLIRHTNPKVNIAFRKMIREGYELKVLQKDREE